MSILRSRTFGLYCGGLLSVAVGAGMSEAMGTTLPLAMGGALALMTTANLVREIRRRRRRGHRVDSRRTPGR